MEQDDLSIGAKAIAHEIFRDRLTPRQVYRLPEEGGWPIFEIRSKLACRRSAMLAEIERREREALGRAARTRRAGARAAPGRSAAAHAVPEPGASSASGATSNGS